MVDCVEHLELARRGGARGRRRADPGLPRRRRRLVAAAAAGSRSAPAARRCGRRSRPPRWRARCVARPRAAASTGSMSYEAHIAGVGDRPPGRPLMGAAIRAMQRASARELAARRARGRRGGAGGRAAALRQRRRDGLGRAHGGRGGGDRGRGRLRALRPDAVRRLRAASRPEPAALFALPVVRRPDDRTATLLGGGYPASGAAGADRLPAPHLPDGPAARQAGGRGRGPDAAARPGRRGSAGRRPRVDAACEGGRAVRALQRAAPGARRGVVETVPTYRGEGEAFL